MNSSMINAMVSMNGLQQKLDVMADNIANSKTVGYKRKETTFQDLLNTTKEQPDAFEQPGRLTSLGINQGWGSRLSVIQPNLEQGSIQETGIDTDVAITGNALFEVMVDGNGTRGYTRNGAFHLTIDGKGDTILATAEGYPVVANVAGKEQSIVVPNGYKLRVNPDGVVQGVSTAGKTVELGTIKLLKVTHPTSLTQVANNLFTVTDGIAVADVLQRINPNAENGVVLSQGALEQSNVNLADEMAEVITVQRAYQLAARALSSSDTMSQLANNLRR